ncbi:MAG: hypothetical protein EXS31_15380 [Pedosphaera sp.]|nr:hypothetical protein [Pedosphaera sp.]
MNDTGSGIRRIRLPPPLRSGASLRLADIFVKVAVNSFDLRHPLLFLPLVPPASSGVPLMESGIPEG